VTFCVLRRHDDVASRVGGREVVIVVAVVLHLELTFHGIGDQTTEA